MTTQKSTRARANRPPLIRDLATDQAKREVFDRLTSHLKVLADQVEQANCNERPGPKAASSR